MTDEYFKEIEKEYKPIGKLKIESDILSMMTNSDIGIILRDKQQELKQLELEHKNLLKPYRGNERKIYELMLKDFYNKTKKEVDKWSFIFNERTGKGGTKVDLDKYKNQIPLTDVMGLFGVKVNSTRRNIKCPFPNHKDSTASFKVYDNHFYCFGCHSSGTQIDFIKHITNCDTKDAVKKFIEIGKNYII